MKNSEKETFAQGIIRGPRCQKNRRTILHTKKVNCFKKESVIIRESAIETEQDQRLGGANDLTVETNLGQIAFFKRTFPLWDEREVKHNEYSLQRALEQPEHSEYIQFILVLF